jgi:hypothetical protein
MNQKIWTSLTIVLLTTGCAKSFTVNDNDSKLIIDSISPTSGPAGTPVLIYGKGFSSRASGNKVFFRGLIQAIVDSNASFNVLKVVAPSSPYNGSGNVSVIVNEDTAIGPLFTWVNAFPAPVITSVVYNGVLVIQGQHFDSLVSVVTIGGQTVPGFTWSDYGYGQQVLSQPFYTPPSNLDNPAPVTVTVRGEVSNSYSYLFYPQINKFSADTTGPNKPLTVTGLLFGNRAVTSSLKAFYYPGGNQGAKTYMTPDPVVTSWNTNTIQITIPDYSNYTVGITLITIYLEVNVSTKSTNKSLLYLR